MKRFKSVVVVTMVIMIVLTLCGCAECIDTQYEDVEVTIVDKYYRGAWVQMIPAGKSFVPITHPAQHVIIVEYENLTYRIDDLDTYTKYSDSIGQTVLGHMEIRTYDNGEIKRRILSLE